MADRHVAGVVLDADDEPVPGAQTSTDGDKQQNFRSQTDADTGGSGGKGCGASKFETVEPPFYERLAARRSGAWSY